MLNWCKSLKVLFLLSVYLFLVIKPVATVRAQNKKKFLEKILRHTTDSLLQHVVNNAAKYQIQILYNPSCAVQDR